jgi:hypothetical protein
LDSIIAAGFNPLKISNDVDKGDADERASERV